MTDEETERYGFLQLASNSVLVDVATGKVDLNVLARMELAARGLSQTGAWVGFDRARLSATTQDNINGEG